jgi:hypothetical protein
VRRRELSISAFWLVIDWIERVFAQAIYLGSPISAEMSESFSMLVDNSGASARLLVRSIAAIGRFPLLAGLHWPRQKREMHPGQPVKALLSPPVANDSLICGVNVLVIRLTFGSA